MLAIQATVDNTKNNVTKKCQYKKKKNRNHQQRALDICSHATTFIRSEEYGRLPTGDTHLSWTYGGLRKHTKNMSILRIFRLG